jgi:signal-transduction protein with cAMP-binding, CBS, and nucleotidyltransferase domain
MNLTSQGLRPGASPLISLPWVATINASFAVIVGSPLGVVSVTDIALSEAERAAVEADVSSTAFYSGESKRRLSREDLSGLHLEDGGLTVRDIMTPAVYTVPETISISEMPKTMIAGRLHRLLVTRNHHLVGIITSLDMLKLLATEE